MKQSLEFLRERITDKMPLEEMVAIFEELCREPIENEMVLFEIESSKRLFRYKKTRLKPR